MKITAYLRVSTDRQAADGQGLDVQRAAIRAWAWAGGHRIIRWHTDEGVSGSNSLEAREALPLALADLQAGAAAGIVVHKLDRLARDLIVQESLISGIRKLGGDIFTTAAGEAGYLADDPDDPSRKLIRQVLGAVNEYERSMIALRMKSGRKVKAAKGGYAYGSPAFGQRPESGELAEDQAEAAVAGMIGAMRGHGLSYWEITTALNAAGYPAKRGGTWHPPTIRRVAERLAAGQVPCRKPLALMKSGEFVAR